MLSLPAGAHCKPVANPKIDAATPLPSLRFFTGIGDRVEFEKAAARRFPGLLPRGRGGLELATRQISGTLAAIGAERLKITALPLGAQRGPCRDAGGPVSKLHRSSAPKEFTVELFVEANHQGLAMPERGGSQIPGRADDQAAQFSV